MTLTPNEQNALRTEFVRLRDNPRPLDLAYMDLEPYCIDGEWFVLAYDDPAAPKLSGALPDMDACFDWMRKVVIVHPT